MHVRPIKLICWMWLGSESNVMYDHESYITLLIPSSSLLYALIDVLEVWVLGYMCH